MNTEEVEKEYCSRCPSYKYGCGFITRGLQDKCSQLSDYTDGYERGYEQAKKDLELTWEDMRIILDAENDILRECNSQEELVLEIYPKGEDYYGEILKRFNNQRRK